LCVIRVKKKKKKGKKKAMKKGRKKRPKVNLILSHVNCAFFILDSQIGPHTFRYTNCTLRKGVFFKGEERSNSRFNLLQIGPWVVAPCALV